MAKTAQPQQSQNALRLRNLTPQKIEQVRAKLLRIKVSTFLCFGRPWLILLRTVEILFLPFQIIILVPSESYFIFGIILTVQ